MEISLGRGAPRTWVRYHLPREEQWFHVAEFILKHDQAGPDGGDVRRHRQDPAPGLAVAGPGSAAGQSAGPRQGNARGLRRYFRNLDGYIGSW